MHSALRRLSALLVLVVPVSFIGRAEATRGAARPLPPREPHGFETAPLPDARASEERTESAVVLVVLDGVRWQEVFFGADPVQARRHGMNAAAWANPRDLVPNLQRMIGGDGLAIGAPGHGAEITASGPRFISLPGYLEIFDGRPDPACASNTCAAPPMRTIVDDVVEAGGAESAGVVTSWPNIARAVGKNAAQVPMSAGRKLVDRPDVLRADRTLVSQLDEGARSKAWPGEGDYRPDAVTARIALRYLSVARPRFLFVGLGDADEYGHHNDYRDYLEALHASDAFIGELMTTLDGMGARGRHTTVLVTADHGRAYGFQDHGARYPESGRVWLVAGGADVRGRGLVSASREYTLSDVAPTVRALLGIRGDGDAIAEIADAP